MPNPNSSNPNSNPNPDSLQPKFQPQILPTLIPVSNKKWLSWTLFYQLLIFTALATLYNVWHTKWVFLPFEWKGPKPLQALASVRLIPNNFHSD